MTKQNIRKKFAAFIKDYRKENGLSLSAFGVMIEKERQYVWKIEHCLINVTADYMDDVLERLNKEHEHIFK